MKKLSFIVMAGLLVLGLTQCKKNEPTNTNNADNGNRVSITLKLENGGGQRVHPEEENGIANVVYDNGDVVLVGSAGKYMGSLTYNGTLFTGSINDAATVGEPLQFIFLGGQSISGLTENASTEYTFNIGDQSIDLAVISCAPSNEDFSATNLSYTAYLRNKCALVKFSLGETGTDAAISLTGVKTEATINFDGTVTNGTATGNIVTYGTGATRYAVVLSDQEAVTGGNISAEGYEGTFNIPTAAYTNAFLTNATITLTAPAPTLAQTMTTAGMAVKVKYNYNSEENYCQFLSNGDGTYTFQSGDGYAGGDDDRAKALVVEDGKLVFKQNFHETIDNMWEWFGFSVTFNTSNNTYSEWRGEIVAENELIYPSFISVEVNGTTIDVTHE